MHVYKNRDDRDYIRPSRRGAEITTIALADEQSAAHPSPVHALQAGLVGELAGRKRQSVFANWHRSRLLVVGALSSLCWVPLVAVALILRG